MRSRGAREAAGTREERARLVERLAAVVGDLNAHAELDGVLRRICVCACELVDGAASAFVVSERGAPVVAATHGDPPADATFARSDLVRAVLAGGDPTIAVGDHVGRFASMAALPAAANGRVHGALHVFFDRVTPTPVEVDVLALLAGHAAVALTRAYTFDEMMRRHLHEHAVLNAMADGVAVIDPDGRVSTWNRAAESITGLAPLDVLGEHLPFDIDPSGEPIEHCLGSGRWIEAIATPLRDTREWVVAFRDVTRQKALEEAKSRFLATTSHELKTPLTVIAGFAHTLLERADELSPDVRTRALEAIVRRSAALGDLIEQLLLGSKIESGHVDVRRVEFDLLPALQAAANGFETVSPRHRLVVELPLGLPLVVGDPGSIEKILGQLLENAFKYSPGGGEVRVTADCDDRMARVRVLDEGIGLDPALAERVFDRFYQAEASDSRRFGGVGLGLSIVRALVEAQGGRITASPRDGCGSEFAFTLPLAAMRVASASGPTGTV